MCSKEIENFDRFTVFHSKLKIFSKIMKQILNITKIYQISAKNIIDRNFIFKINQKSTFKMFKNLLFKKQKLISDRFPGFLRGISANFGALPLAPKPKNCSTNYTEKCFRRMVRRV